MRRAKTPVLIEAAEYEGERAVIVACTQLGARVSARRAQRIVDEWAELLGEATPLASLEFTTRTPRRLFDALAGQPQLTRLVVKWGDYADLSPLGGLRALRHLELRGASAVTDVGPLAGLGGLESLVLEGFQTLADTSPLAHLRNLGELELGGAWMTPRNGHLGSIEFLRSLPRLERVLLHTVVVDDLDYSPLLDLPSLRSVRVMEVRGMEPVYDELRRRLPWSA